MLYLVSYTLNPPRKNPELEKALQSTGIWWHHLDFTWIIVSQETIEQLYNRIAPHLHKSDHELILEIPPNARYYGWLPKEAWDWIQNNRDR